MSKDRLLDDVSKYYAEKLQEHGTSSKGVDWKDDASQNLRFRVLLNGIGNPEAGSLLDYGCGFGSLRNYLDNVGFSGAYTGFDISKDMIAAASSSSRTTNATWTSEQPSSSKFDFVLASGIFNVRLEYSSDEWDRYIKETLSYFAEVSEKAFTFNMLTAYSDKEFQRDYLYYADPGYWFDYCKKQFSTFVSLQHDYQLYEFTLSVKTEPFI